MTGLLISACATGLAVTGTMPAWLTTDRIVVLCMPLATLAAIVVLNTLDKAGARKRKAAASAARPTPQWGIALLVDANEESGIIRPIVQAFGPALPSEITITVVVRDEDGVAEMSSERRFIDPQTTTDLVMGTLTLPDDVSMEKAAGWDWVVSVVHEGREIADRRGPVSASGLVNDEGELRTPDLEPLPDVPEPPPQMPDPVRHPGLTTGLAGAAIVLAIGGYLLTTLTPWLWLAAGPLFVVAGFLLVAAALMLYTTCPLCGCTTSVVGRTGLQRCDSCNGQFTSTSV
jgi:hypothetical protein